jgi:hypothetical protein
LPTLRRDSGWTASNNVYDYFTNSFNTAALNTSECAAATGCWRLGVTHNLWFQHYRLPQLNTVSRWSFRSTCREERLPARSIACPTPTPTPSNPAMGDIGASGRPPSHAPSPPPFRSRPAAVQYWISTTAVTTTEMKDGQLLPTLDGTHTLVRGSSPL